MGQASKSNVAARLSRLISEISKEARHELSAFYPILSAEMNFSKFAAAHRLKPDTPLYRAVELVIVHQVTAYAASKATGVNEGQLSKRLKRIRETGKNCPCCGQKLLDK